MEIVKRKRSFFWKLDSVKGMKIAKEKKSVSCEMNQRRDRVEERGIRLECQKEWGITWEGSE